MRTRFLLGIFVLLIGAAAFGEALCATVVLRPPTDLDRSAVADYLPRPFPGFLQLGTSGLLQFDSARRGNARMIEKTGRPSILREGPRLLSERGEDPLAELEKIRVEAEPETIRILGIRVDFERDGAGVASTGDGRFDFRDPDDAQVPIDPPPHDKAYFESHLEAVGRYYDVQSNGSLVLEYDVFPADPDSAYHLSDTARYGPWIFSVSSDSILARAERFVRDSIELADSLDSAIDWKNYQSFLLFHAGADFQGDINRDTNYDIPSFNLFLGDSLEVIVGGADSVRVNLVMVIPETVSQDGFLGALNGVMAHEYGHQLGFFDLYDVFSGLPRVGVFSLMDSGDGQFGTIGDPYQDDAAVAVRGVLPASLDPWHKLLFFPQTANIRELRDGDEVGLQAIGIQNDILYAPIHYSEYFLVENRPVDYNGDDLVILRADPETGVVLGPEPAEENPDDDLARLEYDYLLPGAGVLIWHIDEFAATEALLAYGGLNIFGDRLGVDVEEADGIQDIGSASPEFLGGPFDPFFEGGFTLFGPETEPDSRTNDGTETGIRIEILDPPGNEMRVRFGAPLETPGWPLALIGAAPKNGLNRIDLGGDGFDDLLLAAGNALIGMTADGNGFADEGEQLLFALLPDTLDEGPVVAPDGGGFETFGLPVVAVRSDGTGFWFGMDGGGIGRWPIDPSDGTISAGPILSAGSGHWVVGTAEGDAILLTPQLDGSLVVLDRFALAEPDTIIRLACGRVALEAPVWLAFGDVRGRVSLMRIDESPVPPPVTWETGAGPASDLLLFRAPIRFGESPQDLILVSSVERQLALRNAAGELLPGWPRTLPDSIVGSPAVGDPDGDGVLEVVAVTRSGSMHLIELTGTDEPSWPQSVWHPDQTRRPQCTTGPRLWDLGGDGSIEIVQLRGDGIVIVLDSFGDPLAGWPYATGVASLDGPVRLIAPNGSERWFFADALSDTVTAIAARAFRPGEEVWEDRSGCFPAPGGGPRRSGVLSAELLPVPESYEGFLDEASLILHPNPVRNGPLRIRYVLGEEARFEGRLFDLSGRQVALTSWDGHVSAGGETQGWDLGAVAPGAYILRLHVEGGANRRTIVRPIAIVR